MPTRTSRSSCAASGLRAATGPQPAAARGCPIALASRSTPDAEAAIAARAARSAPTWRPRRRGTRMRFRPSTPRSRPPSALGAAGDRPAGRRAALHCRADGPHRQGTAHPGDARPLRHRGEGGAHPGGPGGDPVRARRRPGREAVAHRGPVRQPGAGPGGALDPDPGAHPRRGLRGRRDPEQRLRPGHPEGGPRQPQLRGPGREEQARLRPRPGCRRPAVQRRPRQDAARAHRRRHRIGQERLRQRPHLLDPDEGHPARREVHHDRPQAGRDGAVQGHPAPAVRGDRRAGAGGQRPEVDGRHHGGPLPRVRAARASATSPRTTRRCAPASRGCPTSWWSSTSWPT